MTTHTLRLPYAPPPRTKPSALGPFEFPPPGSRYLDLLPNTVLYRGGTLPTARAAYETLGQASPTGDNVILILGGLSADAHVASSPDDPRPGWWESMVGPGRAVDTSRWHVICVNSLGSCRGSTGPASISPATGQPYRLDFPDLSVEDIADTAAQVVRSLGHHDLACVIGTSMGGMTALALQDRHPSLARAHINVSAAPAAAPLAIALRSIQREAIRSDPAWQNGHYDNQAYPLAGMTIARKLGMVTYRSARTWDTRFGRARLHGDAQPFGAEFEVEAYLQEQADRFLRRFDPNSYLYLSRAMDRYEYEPSPVQPTSALTDALVLGVTSDSLFPLGQQLQIADTFTAKGVTTQFLAIDSDHGHDAFLVDTAHFGAAVAGLLHRQFLSPHTNT